MLPALFSRYALIGYAVAGGLFLAGAAVIQYGNARYEAGVAKERGEWEDDLAQWEEKSRLANEALARLSAERDAAIAERDRARQRLLAQTEREIENAPDFEGRYSAYLAFRNGVRQRGAERHARARADYLSSIAPDTDPGARSGRSEFRGIAKHGGSGLCEPA